MLTSLDGYTEDEHGRFGWGAPEDEEVHSNINALASSLGTYLYGRRMYETMAYWEAAHTIPGQQQFVLDFARQWQAADKVVYARTWPGHVAPGRASSGSSMPTLPGDSKPTPRTTSPLMALNSPAIRAGLVDVRMIVCPAVVGGGKRFFPDGVRLDLGLLEERRLDSGVVILRYGIQGTAGR